MEEHADEARSSLVELIIVGRCGWADYALEDRSCVLTSGGKNNFIIKKR
jgi:hypothetical protein